MLLELFLQLVIRVLRTWTDSGEWRNGIDRWDTKGWLKSLNLRLEESESTR